MARSAIQINITFPDASSATIYHPSVASGSAKIRTSFSTGNTVEIGCVSCRRFDVTIRDHSTGYAAKDWEGAKLEVLVDGKRRGIFTVFDQPRYGDNIPITAYDSMYRFNEYVDFSEDAFRGKTLRAFCSYVCQRCGFSAVSVNEIPEYILNEIDIIEGCTTYREALSWICQLSGKFAYINENDELKFGWYTESGKSIKSKNRALSGSTKGMPITVSGIKIFDGFSGSENGNIIEITDCGIKTKTPYQTIAGDIATKINLPFIYIPFSAQIFDIDVSPGKIYDYVLSDGTSHKTYITESDETVNGALIVTSAGESGIRSGVKFGAFSAGQQVIAKKEANKAVSSSAKLTATIAGGMGLNETEIDGKRYYHNGESLAVSTIIYTFNSSGFAWTKSWNNGNPAWKYGFTADGNAILNTLSAYQIEAQTIFADKLHLTNGAKIGNLDITANGLSVTIPKTQEGISSTIAFSNPGVSGSVGGLEGKYVIYANGRFGISESGEAIFGADTAIYVDQYMRFDPKTATLEIKTSDGENYTCVTTISSGLRIEKNDESTVSVMIDALARAEQYGLQIYLGALGDSAGIYVNVPGKYENLLGKADEFGSLNILALLDELVYNLP